jgi:hypothetical protein
MTSGDRDASLEELLAAPFPKEITRAQGRESGPGYHLQIIQEGRDFWDDRSEELIEAAEAEMDRALQELLTSSTRRWGTPETIDLDPYLWSSTPAPEPLLQLSMLTSDMVLWRHAGSTRWLALAVGQGDTEFPLQLLAAVGANPFPKPDSPPTHHQL